MEKNYKYIESKKSKIKDEEIIVIYQNGTTISNLAKIAEVSDRTIRRILKKHNIPLESKHSKINIKCLNCDEDILILDSEKEKRKYCSKECYIQYSKKTGSRTKNKVGQKINDWEFLENVGKDAKHSLLYLVRCKCGYEKITKADNIVNQTSKCCFNCSFRKKMIFEGFISNNFLKYIKRHADKRGIEFNISKEYLEKILKEQNYLCFFSGESLTFPKSEEIFDTSSFNSSLDRIDSSKGYIEGNVQWVTKIINFMKRTYSNFEFITICKQITKYQEDKNTLERH